MGSHQHTSTKKNEGCFAFMFSGHDPSLTRRLHCQRRSVPSPHRPRIHEGCRKCRQIPWNKRFESELDTGLDTQRGERNAPPYVPTFFTSQTNHEQLTNSRLDNPRPQREINTEPLYYETYHNRR